MTQIKYAAYVWHPKDNVNPMLSVGYSEKQAKNIAKKNQINKIYSPKELIQQNAGLSENEWAYQYVVIDRLFAAEIDGKKIDIENMTQQEENIIAQFHNNLMHLTELEFKSIDYKPKELDSSIPKEKLKISKKELEVLHSRELKLKAKMAEVAPISVNDEELSEEADANGIINVYTLEGHGNLVAKTFDLNDFKNCLILLNSGGILAQTNREPVGFLVESLINNVSYTIKYIKEYGKDVPTCFAKFKYQGNIIFVNAIDDYQKDVVIGQYNPETNETICYRGNDKDSQYCKDVVLACGRMRFEEFTKYNENGFGLYYDVCKKYASAAADLMKN